MTIKFEFFCLFGGIQQVLSSDFLKFRILEILNFHPCSCSLSFLQAREFYANPLPDLENINLPPKKPKAVTAPEPFNLDTDNRGSKKAEEWSQKVGISISVTDFYTEHSSLVGRALDWGLKCC